MGNLIEDPALRDRLHVFVDRTSAGQRLATHLSGYRGQEMHLFAIPSGGVPVATEIARALLIPLDLIIVRKIQLPWTTEAGFGAVAADGTLFLRPAASELPREVVERQTQLAMERVKQRERDFLKYTGKADIGGRTAILVDDGLAAGSTMLAAIRSARKRSPARVIVAAPTASGGAAELLEGEADQVIVLYEHPRGLPFAVASSYEEWHDLTDEEVRQCLQSAQK